MISKTVQKSHIDIKEQKIQDNIANWQSSTTALTSLSEAQLDVLYQIKDLVDQQYNLQLQDSSFNKDADNEHSDDIPVVNTNPEYIKWIVKVENEIKLENLNDYFVYFAKLKDQTEQSKALLTNAEATLNTVNDLFQEYQEVTAKTDSLHSLSEQLMKNQKQLKRIRTDITEHLYYFKAFNSLSDNIDNLSNNIGDEFMQSLDKIDECMDYLCKHPNFKETQNYLAKYEMLLSKSVILLRKYFNEVIVNVTTQIIDPDNRTILASTGESAFSLYYGKSQSASVKVQPIIKHIEEKVNKHNSYKQLIYDFQQTYFAERSPIMINAVSKALLDLKNKYKSDPNVLFRSAALFIMQSCQDEATCFKYFFSTYSSQLNEYLGILCQCLYDMLRPCLISIYHLEVLTELCSILRKEMLNDLIQNDEVLIKFTEIIKQLLQDVEERLVFRTHIFFQNDLISYQPSPGDLAYPEKLQQLQNIAEDINVPRADSRSSIVSIESQEVANINTNYFGQFRSYTGNSPADLHGMWYPTVKRILVCLSRLYFCLEREIFQGLAQEGLSICVETIEKAQTQIAARKSLVDGRLFQIKHLLILREQIAPFQVDFTVKEVRLDFSNIKTAAVGLIHNRDKLFVFSTNNALLEFLLEGTPKVKEYLLDSRKEIDKQLKISCEAFISHASSLLIGNILKWISKAENFLNDPSHTNTTLFLEQEFFKPQILAGIISTAQRNMKSKIPEIQKSMQLYLANKETEFILFRPIKNAVINAFIQVEHILTRVKYTADDQVIMGCPTPEQINVLICSVSLTAEQEN